MAIVKTMTSGTATVHIDDSCCAGLSAAEKERRWAEVDRAIWRINRAGATRGEEKVLDASPGMTRGTSGARRP